MISEREKLEFDSVPEFVREPRSSARDSYTSNIASSTTGSSGSGSISISSSNTSSLATDDIDVKPSTSRQSGVQAVLPKSAELEALWPGVGHEFLHSSKRGATFYLSAGFAAGIVFSIIAASGFFAVSKMLASGTGSGKEIVVASQANGPKPGTADGRGGQSGITSTAGEPDVILPLSPTYEVGAGDTLAAIALKNYKRATPRLLDEICKANNMRNANVLSLGQKLALPEYRPQSKQIAVGGNTAQQ